MELRELIRQLQRLADARPESATRVVITTLEHEFGVGAVVMQADGAGGEVVSIQSDEGE
jgi:hypothetical protein